ncbi:hypothetical protein A3D05_01365 [Candidatus Gottesmanbacteria bacterium RIFCSPHIGHO2_02_FULL_40_24]|uniref:Uncharacterized protein n=1 Tax=Candidatus Gottesmanbacteria bacterium RIFCSPHIGHO2_01_FULL_40_15 TaxID=1798376 RepID=A0A1F5Z1I1_9BACT|nr:MAG: hypothetical protein A2777_05340 [Candidatus Gottesmanbacteria bacterium RIFCSPHIGHO2_01_FULL_40_15]OGG17123.1 MAG: hypothetical protein A3D05_01365 [Candidatus Gottesmanbacteria bacterium RIFCSPHIGHO2_02_FULL_40_24]OGG21982.1 MAG: hypothetical protein A3B48_06045 [Candidatus Gottesmanbacteria bacterium RIFCSPLOWO2_01_FULL_40_10]OGG23170.1 MAG: hypothetical protein A3E42_03455 [Candidatus Gottesmanbacteria bacterium RIFCSPHIGHO2_12_FULL_40_13]
MPKQTLAVILALTAVAALLIGINIGKKLGVSQYLSQTAPTPAPLSDINEIPSPTVNFPTPVTESIIDELTYEQDRDIKSGSSSYTDKSCGFTLTYTGSYLEQNSQNGKSTIITNPDNPQETIITACQDEIPKPPLPPEKIENITLDGVLARLYHDTSSKDGSPRDEVIVTHPTLFHEIIIAGYGRTFNEAVTSFKFIR